MYHCDLKPADFPASSPCRRKIGEKVEKDTFQTVNKTADFTSNQTEMHGGVCLYTNQLCKVESISCETSTCLKALDLWLLTNSFT